MRLASCQLFSFLIFLPTWHSQKNISENLQQNDNAKTILAKETKKNGNDFIHISFFFMLMTINISVTRAVIPSRLPQQLHYSSDRRCRVRNAKLCIFSSFSSFYRESEFLPRWEQVLEELKTKGIYDLTFEELEFGVRTAWRNAARCSARIQWENLVILISK